MSSPPAFAFPWQHSFPPFYTLQPQRETRSRQLAAWRTLVLDYCQKKGLSVVDVGEIAKSDLFVNKTINRRLGGEALDAVLEDLRAHGHLEWTDKSKKRCHIYYRTPEEWGGLIYSWARDNGMTGAVCTFYELTEGDDAREQPFAGLDRGTLVKALRALQIERKAELFPEEEGVKFF